MESKNDGKYEDEDEEEEDEYSTKAEPTTRGVRI